MTQDPSTGFHGPKCWLVSYAVGLTLGALCSGLLPAPSLAGGVPDVPVYLAAPFGLLLLSLALMPLLEPRFWERHYPDFALFLGGLVMAYYPMALGASGLARMEHTWRDYFQFMALIGSLYVVTGGIHIEIRGQGTPRANTLLLAAGAVLANLLGTTGASMLLIRPYLRLNRGRLCPYHVVFFIFVVSNCGGCLTAIGDPPLFLGYLKGVPFDWTLRQGWAAWALCVGLLLLVFFFMDALDFVKRGLHAAGATPPEKASVRIDGWKNGFYLAVVLFGVFLDKLLREQAGILTPFPFGACLQVGAAVAAYAGSKPEHLRGNEFSFRPLEEVGLIFIGIFTTMVPALDYLQNNASGMGITSPTAFYWASGSLSSLLDNAPTYLSFFTTAHGLAGPEYLVGLPPEGNTPAWLALATVGATGFSAQQLLLAISLGAVFFGAGTYIGNGPNFMVKAIAESAGVKMPSFLGYIFRFTLPILIPIFLAVWLACVR